MDRQTQEQPDMGDARKSSTRESDESSPERLSEEERAAIKERAAELKAAGKRGRGAKKANGENDLLAKIAELAEPDRILAERLHALITTAAPDLSPTTWYGMPAWALNGKVLCFFQPATKFKTRYATFGFNENAKLDDGALWPTAYALTALGDAEEAAIRELVTKAAG
jgi:uncharacterized protein YdhG (YjbR/CyaY superfamily)